MGFSVTNAYLGEGVRVVHLDIQIPASWGKIQACICVWFDDDLDILSLGLCCHCLRIAKKELYGDIQIHCHRIALLPEDHISNTYLNKVSLTADQCPHQACVASLALASL